MYQYSVDRSGKGGVVGGRSRLHLIDFGGCERTRVPGGGITLSGLGNVILGIFNGQKHLPCRESKVTQVLRECLGSLTCHATMLAHVSLEPSHYSETLHTIQLASRVHRMRRKKIKTSSGGGGSTSSDEHRRMSKLRSRSSGSSDFTSTDPSSSEQSCDTVVYRGHSDGSGTDSEHPPVFIPSLSSGDNRGIMSKALRGSCEEMARPRRLSGSKILTNGTISPAGRQSLSPQPHPMSPMRMNYLNGSPRSPNLPSIRESIHQKMPLNGRIPGYRQPAEQRINSPRNQQSNPARNKQEIWVDGVNQNVNKPRMYGYMDEYKANMISHWVENQSGKEDNAPLYLTQFKQADSDSGSEKQQPMTKVEIHSHNPSQFEVQRTSATVEQHETKTEKKLAPAPPPRKTPPREDRPETVVGTETDASHNYNHQPTPRAEVEGSDSPEPLEEPHSLDDIFIQWEKLVNSLCKEGNASDKTPEVVKKSGTDVANALERRKNEQINQQILKNDSGSQVSEKDIKVSRFDSPMEHPLRILSTENLSVVSTFVADINDLESMEDETEYDPSKFSFFEVPELNLNNDKGQDEYLSLIHI